MTNQPKSYHQIFAIIFILLCGCIFVSYSWIGFATLTEMPGLNADYYYYYRLTRLQFYIYNFLIALTAFVFIIFFIKYLIQRNLKLLKKTSWNFAIFIGLLLIIEIYLSSRFVGKG